MEILIMSIESCFLELEKGLQLCKCGRNSNKEKRESLDFVLPDQVDPVGRQCHQFNTWYCMMGYWINYKQSDRQPQENDKQLFEQLVKTFFFNVNWYSFKPQDAANGGCCSYQTKQYIEYGQKFGLSPRDYLDKIVYFTAGASHHNLVFLKVRWDEQLCVNIVTQVGFGIGQLKVVGDKRMTKPFAIPRLGGSTNIYVYEAGKVKKDLNFTWFMHFVICKDKPELCPDLPPIQGSSSRGSDDGR
ncbi:uncharacterized protein LOC142349547 isoform X2 [Convolutriloba macropyga]|uniref:uncharacterized protein LOC142349547 isoform X2 n=1 Tax=Convolutriloba macropyga TaxID=536237 RepID=UPI003F51ECCF